MLRRASQHSPPLTTLPLQDVDRQVESLLMELKHLPQRPAAQRAARRASRSPMPLATAVPSAREDASSGSGMAEASPPAADAADEDEVLLVGGSSDEVGARAVLLALLCCDPPAPTKLFCDPHPQSWMLGSAPLTTRCLQPAYIMRLGGPSDEVGHCISMSMLHVVFANLVMLLGRWSWFWGLALCCSATARFWQLSRVHAAAE